MNKHANRRRCSDDKLVACTRKRESPGGAGSESARAGRVAEQGAGGSGGKEGVVL